MIRAQLKITLKSDYSTLINCTNLTIDPESYALLQKAKLTSAAVDMSFSMLSKLLRRQKFWC